MSTDMYERAYFGVNEVLDKALGPEEEDGAGEGIVADVMLLAHRYELALKALEAAGAGLVAAEIRRTTLPEHAEPRTAAGHPAHTPGDSQ